MPMRWPLPQVSRPSIAATPVSIGSTIGARLSGDGACPFTTLYWDFLLEHEDEFRSHQRMALQVRNLDRKSADDKQAIRDRARYIRRKVREGTA